MNRTSAFPGFAAASAGFDEPLEMLGACHDRIAAQCATLRRLAAHVAASGSDENARTAARNVIRYFETAGRHHHDDEERDVFPALVEAAIGTEAAAIGRLVESLTDDHRELERNWRALAAWLASIEAGEVRAPEPGLIDRFIEGYERHIAREERDLLPAAARLLAPDTMARIGHSMGRRRGVGAGSA